MSVVTPSFDFWTPDPALALTCAGTVRAGQMARHELSHVPGATRKYSALPLLTRTLPLLPIVWADTWTLLVAADADAAGSTETATAPAATAMAKNRPTETLAPTPRTVLFMTISPRRRDRRLQGRLAWNAGSLKGGGILVPGGVFLEGIRPTREKGCHGPKDAPPRCEE